MKDRGFNIIATSNSWGGGDFSQALLEAIEAHRQRGRLFITAAGMAIFSALDKTTIVHLLSLQLLSPPTSSA
jgi:hypothetical protein